MTQIEANAAADGVVEKDRTRSKRYGWRDVVKAIFSGRTGTMFVLGIASGIPFAALIGTLNAWLTQSDIRVSTIGVISFIGLAYSFNFLWAPALQRSSVPGLGRLGRRRSWMLFFQAVTVFAFILIAFSDPQGNLAAMTGAAAIAAFASASFHVVVDAWRIEVADDDAPLDLLSSVYQFGFRSAGFLAGAVALLLAERLGWGTTYLIVAVIAVVCLIVTFWAREPRRYDADGAFAIEPVVGGDLKPEIRLYILAPVLLGWAYAAFALFGFMVSAVTSDPPPSASAFTRGSGPFIVLASVFSPALAGVAIIFLRKRADALGASSAAWARSPLGRRVLEISDILYASILAPMAELIGRLRWAALIVLLLALSYRFTDAVWGAFAYTFYLGDPAAAAGALHHSLDDVFIASKTFGVAMTIAGIGLGGVLLLKFGRMPILLAGAVLAAGTNLLFADLALGASAMDAFLGFTQLDHVFGAFGLDQRMARLMTAIAFENLAVGVASAAIVAYLSAIVNPRYSAVQYALLASLALLIGTFGRGALGEMIDTDGFAPVFILTAWLGLFAVVMCIIEWVRLSMIARRDNQASAQTAGG